MAVPADFKSHLATLSHLYFKASSTSTRIVGSSSVVGSSSDKWKVSIVSIPDAGEMSYFERTLSYKDIQSMTKTLGEFSWASFWKHIRTTLRSGEMIFDVSAKQSIQLFFSKGDSGLSSSIDAVIPKADDEDKSKAASFLFTFVERIQTLETKLLHAESAVVSVQHKLVEAISPKKQPITQEYEGGVKAIALVGAKATGNASSSSTESKKTGGSLLNPGRKKYVPKPTTLGN